MSNSIPQSRTGATVVTGGLKSKQLKRLIDETLGVTDTVVWYERPGQCVEMMGQEGGWFFESIDAEQSDPLGTNFDEAVQMAKLLQPF